MGGHAYCHAPLNYCMYETKINVNNFFVRYTYYWDLKSFQIGIHNG